MSALDGVKSHDDDDDDIAFEGLDILSRQKNGNPFPRAINVLSQEMIRRTIPHRVLTALRRGRSLGVILVVRSGLQTAFRSGLTSMCSEALRVIICSSKANDNDILSALNGFGSGAPVVLISDRLDQVPRSARLLCAHSYFITAVDPESVRNALRLCTRGRVPKGFDADVSDLPLTMIAASIVPGARARHAMTALQKLAVPAVSKHDADELPELETCIEYGPARDWGLQLGRDIVAWKEGRLAASDVDRAILLVSPPGFGKTYFARVLQRHLGVPLFRLGISELFSGNGYLHVTMKKITDVFEEARAKAPSIIFMDELDSFPVRSQGRENDAYFNSLVNHLLVLMDGVGSDTEGVVVVGATNRADAIEPALMRPGRFSRVLEVPLPDSSGRLNILRNHLRGDLADVSLTHVSAICEGLTAADLMHVVVRARAIARNHERGLLTEDLLEAIDPPGQRTAAYDRRIAIHESGHAVCATVLSGSGFSLLAASLVRSRASGGRVTFATDGDSSYTRDDIEKRIAILLAGRAAETIVLGGPPTPGAGGAEESDFAKATSLAAASLASHGLYGPIAWRASPTDAMDVMRFDPSFRSAVEDLLQQQMKIAEAVILENRDAVEFVANLLVEQRVVDAATIASIVKMKSGDTSPAPTHAVSGDQP